jgi:flagellar hook-associated protein 3 FlgL
MRITNLMMTNQAIQNMAKNLEKVSNLQSKIASNKQFQVPSDDPLHASTSLNLRSQLQTLESYSETASLTENWQTATDNAFDQLEQIAVRANELILSGLNDTLSGSERANTLGAEMQELIAEAVEVGNTSVNGQYIFSGYQVNQKAFSLTDAAAPLLDYAGNPFTPKVANYLGDTGVIQRSLGPDQSVALNVRGDQAILGFLQNLIVASNALTQNNVRNTGNPLTDPLTLESSLGNLKISIDTLDQYRTSNGARLRQVTSASNFLESVKLETQNLLSENEDINLAESISLLANQQTTYEAVLEVSQRAISALSLFDYLR